MQNRNTRFLVFMLAAFGFMMIWAALHQAIYPPIPPEEDPSAQVAEKDGKGGKDGTKVPPPTVPTGLATQFSKDVAVRAESIARAERLRELEKQRAVEDRVTALSDLIALGSEEPDSPFHLGVKLDPRGAGVRSVLLNKFSRMDQDGRPAPGLFELIPGDDHRNIPANVLYHFPDLISDRPVDELGRVVWKASAVRAEKVDDGRSRQIVEFTTQVAGVEIVKRFSLTEREYHLGLELQFTRKEEFAGKGANRFRYQLTGAHGLPIEGKWFTNFFRTSLIGQEYRNTIFRDFQDVRQIGVWGGGEVVNREENKFFRYAGIAVQYFASVVVVDQQENQTPRIARVRPTLERGVTRGTLKSVAPDQSSFVLQSANHDYTFQVLNPFIRAELTNVPLEIRIAVVSTTNRYGKEIAEQVEPEFHVQPLWVDDITVRLTSETLDLEKDKPVVHKFVLYNGPVKVSLLSQMKDERAVPPEVVARYVDTFHLNTLTDYQSPGWIGSFSNSIYWTPLVINTTNLMHWVLNQLYTWVPNYGVCIILLTVLVRGLMFPLSLRQAKTMQKMQVLGPELKALNEKYKDDRQGMAAAQMELYRKHGVNPFGTCWVLLLQLPIFMGLWYALQESIFFRLAPFWPTWVVNLAAPDMLFHWGRHIPVISRDMDYGGFLYLGPYLNILPLIAVALMLVQQKMMTPPPTNEQEEANQRVMTIMMCVMGLLFYKVAAGLCIYFIATSLWGVAERQFLPKVPKPGEKPAETAAPATSSVQLAGSTSGGSTGISPTTQPEQEPRDYRGRSKKGKKGRRPEQKPTPTGPPAATEEQPTTALGRFAAWWRSRRRALAEWWAEVLRQAEKK